MSSRIFASESDARVLQQAGILRFGLIFLQGILLVKLGVPLELIGQIELVFFLANFMTFYLQNGGKNAMLSWTREESSADLGHRLGTVYIAMHVLGIAAAALLPLIQFLPIGGSYGFMGSAEFWLVAAYIGLTVPVTPLIYNYLLTGRQSRILWYIGISYGLQVGIVLGVLIGGGSILDVLMLLVALAGVRWIFSLIDGKWFVNGLPGYSSVVAFVAFSAPLIFHALNSGLMDFIDGWIVSGYYGEELFAVYRYGAKELPLNALLIGGLLTGLIPGFRKSGEVDGQKMRKELARLIRILFPINCALILFSPILYELVYSSEFVRSARIFNIYATTLIARIVINQVYLYVFHKNWILALSTMGEIVVNIILSIFLLRQIGLIGIPLATAIAYLLHKIFMILYIQLKMRVSFEHYMPVRLYALAFIAMIASVSIAEIIYF